MARIVEDQEQGVVEATEMPDVKATASSLKEKGYSRTQIEDVISSLPVNKSVASQLLAEFPEEELEGGRAEFNAPEADVVLERGAQFNPEAFNTEETVEFQSADVEEVDFGFVGEEVQKFMASRTEGAKKELSVLAGSKLNVPEEQVRMELDNNDETLVTQALVSYGEQYYQGQLKSAEKSIQEAQDSMSVADVLTQLKEKTGRTPTLAEQRAAYVQHMSGGVPKETGELDLSKLSPILRETVQSNMLSMDMAKMKEEYENSTSYLGMALDFLELPTPTATVSEEHLKYTNDIYDNLDKLPTLPPEKQKQLIQEMVSAAKNQETFLFNNNNSLLAMGQIDTVYNALLQGASLQAEGATEAEVRSMLESALNGTIFVGEVAGLVKGIGNIGKFLMRRIHSSKNLKALSEEQDRLVAALIDQEARARLSPGQAEYVIDPKKMEVSVEPVKRDKRERLKQRASVKGTRKERKALEAEKKQLGARVSELESKNLNQEARRVSKENKISFKQALKQVKEANSAEIATIKARQETNQELINDFDRAASAESELSRTETFLQQGRFDEADLFEETGEFGFRVDISGGAVLRAVPFRENANAFDSLYKFNPTQKLKVTTSEEGLKGVVKATGMSAEEVAERMMPNPSGGTVQGLGNSPGPRELNDLVFLDADPLEDIGPALGRELERANGTSLHVDHSATRFDGTTKRTEDSLGTFTFLLGDGAQGGFKSKELAEEAMEQAATGYGFRVVEKENGFFLEVDVDHYINPYTDVKALEFKGKTPSWMTAWALDQARNIEDDLVRGLFAMKNVNRSTVQKIEDRAKKAFKGRSAEENKLLLQILEKGDIDEMEWFSKSGIAKDINLDVPDKVFDAYRTIREVYDDIYLIRERNYYQRLRAGNNKYINLGDEFGIGKVIRPKDVEADEIYDTIGKGTIKKEDLTDTDVIVKLGHERDFDGAFRTYVRVKGTDVKELIPGSTLNRRKGHIDRMYRDAGWVVKTPVMKNIDGVDTVKYKVSHIVQTEEQARKIADDIEGAEFSRSRENEELEDIFSDSDNVQFGYGASHLKTRGELAKGPDGTKTAGVLNAFESLFGSIAGVQNALDYNAYQAVKAKFIKAFAPYLKEGGATQFLGKSDDMLKSGAKEQMEKARKGLYTEYVNHYQYIKSLRQHQRSDFYKNFDRALRPMLGLLKFDPNTQEAATKMQRLTSELYIVWNGLYQGVQNMLPAMYIMNTAGINGYKATLMLPAVMLAHLQGNMTALNKLVGNEDLAKELLSELQRNGMIDAIGRSNDFLDLARTEGASVATTTTKAVGKAVKKGLYSTPRTGLLKLQEAPIVTNNVLAYLTEFNKLMKKPGAKFDGKAKAEISFQAQKLTQTQNSLNKFWYQNQSNPMALAGQFMQAVHKFFLDVVVEPQWEVIRGVVNTALKPVTDKHLGSLGKNKGRFADTWTKAAVTTAITYTMFGPEGGLGKGLGMMVEDSIRSQYDADDIPVALDAVLDGGLNTILNAMITAEGELDVNATMSPAAFVDMLSGLVFAGDAGQVNLLGASGFAVAGVAESIYSTGVAVTAGMLSEEMGYQDVLSVIAAEYAENFKFMDSVQKAYIAYWTGRHASSRSLSSELPITPMEASMKLVGIQPELMADYMYRKKWASGGEDGVTDSSFYADKNIDFALQQAARESVSLKTKEALGLIPQVSLEKQNEIFTKWVGITKEITDDKYHDKIERAFKDRFLKYGSPGYDEFVGPYLKAAAHNNNTAAMNLLEQRAGASEAREHFRKMKEAYEIVEGR